MVGSLYLGALRAAAELARNPETQLRVCREHFQQFSGEEYTVEQLFNGEYFSAKRSIWPNTRSISMARVAWPTSCLTRVAQFRWVGVFVLAGQVRSALKAIWTRLTGSDTARRTAAALAGDMRPGEVGLRTGLSEPIPRSSSGSTGTKSGRASNIRWPGTMVWEGMLTEALAICRGIHERYHPARQNPWKSRRAPRNSWRTAWRSSVEPGPVPPHTPREDGLVERLRDRCYKNCVDANVWKSDESPTSGRTVSWRFYSGFCRPAGPAISR